MKKINQGKYEVLTTKEDAIYKFMQMQGICREKSAVKTRLNFTALKKAKLLSPIRQQGELMAKTPLIFMPRLLNKMIKHI